MSDLTRVLNALEHGDPQAAEDVLPLVYEELRRLAAAKMARESPGHTLQPTALVHEAWLRLTAGNPPPWRNRTHFLAAAAEAMRRILVDIARRKARLKHGGDQRRLDLAEVDPPAATADERVLLVHEALEQLETQDLEKARVVELKFFGGLTNHEVAETLGVTERTVERHWAYAKAWLYQMIHPPT